MLFRHCSCSSVIREIQFSNLKMKVLGKGTLESCVPQEENYSINSEVSCIYVA